MYMFTFSVYFICYLFIEVTVTPALRMFLQQQLMMMMMMVSDARCSQYEPTRGNCLHVAFQSSLCYVLEILFPRCLKHFVKIPIQDELRAVARTRLPANCPTGGVTEKLN